MFTFSLLLKEQSGKIKYLGCVFSYSIALSCSRLTNHNSVLQPAYPIRALSCSLPIQSELCPASCLYNQNCSLPNQSKLCPVACLSNESFFSNYFWGFSSFFFHPSSVILETILQGWALVWVNFSEFEITVWGRCKMSKKINWPFFIFLKICCFAKILNHFSTPLHSKKMNYIFANVWKLF